MINRKSLTAALLWGLVLAASAHGEVEARRTMYLTFSAPVSLPGVTLGSGTYIFERVGGHHSLVRVSSRDRRIVYYTAFTNLTMRPAGLPRDRHVMLGESPADIAPPIRAWFPMGQPTGHAFIYDR